MEWGRNQRDNRGSRMPLQPSGSVGKGNLRVPARFINTQRRRRENPSGSRNDRIHYSDQRSVAIEDSVQPYADTYSNGHGHGPSPYQDGVSSPSFTTAPCPPLTQEPFAAPDLPHIGPYLVIDPSAVPAPAPAHLDTSSRPPYFAPEYLDRNHRQFSPFLEMDRDSRSRRYDDGEVTRYGAGESYRPFNSNRSPRRVRSPPRERARSPPPLDSDRYVPNRTPRRRSRTPERFRRDPSRDRRDARDTGDSWRRRDRSRSARRTPPRRSPPLRRSPPPRRASPRRFSPRRDDRERDRLRSPRRGFDSRFPPPPQYVDPNHIPLTLRLRRRSRSPYDRDRGRDRTPPRRSPPPPLRASTYRARSRSPDRRPDDRYVASSYARRPSLPRDSAISSAIPSGDASRRSSPHPAPARRDDRSRPQSPISSRPISRSPRMAPPRDRTPPRVTQDSAPTAPRSPPRGPAALRAPPTGPRETRAYGGQPSAPIGSSARTNSSLGTTPSRQDTGNPPAGPRSYVVPRGGGFGRGGRGGQGWGSHIQSRNLPPATSPASATATTGSSSIPTGPRASSTSLSVPPTPVSQSKPFNPPKGPAAESSRPTFAQQLLASCMPIIPGGRIDPAYENMTTGVLPDLLPHYNRLREEEEKIRLEKYAKEEKLRKSLAMWDRFEHEAKVAELRTELSEQSLKKFAGEGVGGAAF